MVGVRLTRTMVEDFWSGSRVAFRPWLAMVSRRPIIKMDHMPDTHRKYLVYDSDHDPIPETHGITLGVAYFNRKGDLSDD